MDVVAGSVDIPAMPPSMTMGAGSRVAQRLQFFQRFSHLGGPSDEPIDRVRIHQRTPRAPVAMSREEQEDLRRRGHGLNPSPLLANAPATADPVEQRLVLFDGGWFPWPGPMGGLNHDDESAPAIVHFHGRNPEQVLPLAYTCGQCNVLMVDDMAERHVVDGRVIYVIEDEQRAIDTFPALRDQREIIHQHGGVSLVNPREMVQMLQRLGGRQNSLLMTTAHPIQVDRGVGSSLSEEREDEWPAPRPPPIITITPIVHRVDTALSKEASTPLLVLEENPATEEHGLVCWYIDNVTKAVEEDMKNGGGEGLDLFPLEFVCPLSLCAMRDPVCFADGQLYERAWILRAVAEHARVGEGLFRSPLTNQEIPRRLTTLLFPCKPMITMMESWVRSHVTLPESTTLWEHLRSEQTEQTK